jgi:hypothetical protein
MRKRQARFAGLAANVAETPAKPGYGQRAQAFLEFHAAWVTLALVALATARIISTYWTTSYVVDEPAHIACGMEWLEKHTYTYEAQHPPLTRLMTALLPRLAGAHGWNEKDLTQEGIAILSRQGKLDSTLALARAGMLPFFWMLCWVMYASTCWIAEARAPAVIAVFLLTMTPSILAHAGLATTDIGLTATLLLAIHTGWRWMDDPQWRRAAAFGGSLGLALLAKFSTLAFFPSVMLVGLALWLYFERPGFRRMLEVAKSRAVQLLAAGALALLLVWAGYWFSFGKAPIIRISAPAPEFFKGIQDVGSHYATGHVTYLLGEVSTTGWVRFFAVALGVKTPLAVLVLGLLGLGLMCSRRWGARGWMMLAVAVGVLGFSSFFSRIQIGTRHVMPVYVALAVGGGCAAVWLAGRREWGAWIVAAAMAWTAASSIAAHPDYLAYFNVLAGSKPEDVLVDSDLDWGQDMKRLGRRLQELGAREVYFNQFEPGDMRTLYGFPPIRPLDINGPGPGWNVVSPTRLKTGFFGDTRYVYDKGFHFWPDQIEPVERVGTQLLFYNATGAK